MPQPLGGLAPRARRSRWFPRASPVDDRLFQGSDEPAPGHWRQNPEPWNPENIAPEYAGWRAEQHAWHDGVSLSDLSPHMFDTFIDGPDATRLLRDVSANNYEKFAVGQAKQFVPVTGDGNIVTDGILARTAEQSYVLSGIPAAQNWVKYHGASGICAATPDAPVKTKAVGTVEEKDGKKVMTATTVTKKED